MEYMSVLAKIVHDEQMTALVRDVSSVMSTEAVVESLGYKSVAQWLDDMRRARRQKKYVNGQGGAMR